VQQRGVERAWKKLGRLRASEPADLDQLIAALSSPDVGERQVAARLIGDAEAPIAYAAWDRLLNDSSRSVRRATVDVIVDANNAALRPLLEHALLDSDPWMRWKAVVGLVELGIEPSRDAVAPLAHDTDFRVRLEATRALRP
jgi:HEAT repeat protein